MTSRQASESLSGSATFYVRAAIGGVLMGIANLVPGISGGTMLLAAGVYPGFIEGIAEVARLTFRPRTLIPLALICGSAALAILLGAGGVKWLVVHHRWAMYALFIGLTLGGAPLIWRMLRPANVAAWAGCAAGVAVMAWMATTTPGAADADGEIAYLKLFLAGLAGAAAMILPGISGGYLLLILGQYLLILGAIDDAKLALSAAGGPQWETLARSFLVFIPVGLGVALGVAGVTNLIRFLMRRFEKATLGLLLGLLLGAVLGLWPFQEGVPPKPGDLIKGRVATAETVSKIREENYPIEYFQPSPGQVAAAIGLAAAGFLGTQRIARLGARS